jgi:apolipoprotein N-acyltransferase
MSDAPAPTPAAPDAPPVQPHATVRAVLRERNALLLAALSGVLYFLGFASFEILPFAFVSLAPLLVALRGREGWKALRLGWLTGTVLGAGGFYWIVGMLKTFSGFPTALCILFALVLWAAQGLQYGVFAWLLARLDRRGVPRMVSAPLMLAAVELTFPLLFPWYTANSLHNHPLLIQTADLGGVILVSWALALGHTALAEAWVRAGDWKVRLAPLRFPLVFWLFAVPYGAWQLRALNEEDGRTRALRVGVVQENLGLMEKRNDPYDRPAPPPRDLPRPRGPRGRAAGVVRERHLVPHPRRDPQHPRLHPRVGPAHPRALRRPLGARRGRRRPPAVYNTAFITDATGGHSRAPTTRSTSWPSASTSPAASSSRSSTDASPQQRALHPRRAPRALPVPGGTVLPLICYEDILPRFVRDFMRAPTRTSSR